MSTSTVSIAVQMEGTAKAVTDLGTVDRAVREVEKGATEAGGAGAELATGLDKAEGAARKLAGVNVWGSYKQGASGAVASVDSLARSLGELRATSKAGSLSGYNAEIDKLAKLAGVSTASMAGLIRQMDAVRRAEAFDNLQRSAGLSTIQLAKLRAETGDVAGAFGTLAAGAGQAKLAIAAVTAVAVLAGKSCLDAALQADKLNKAYGTITGSAAGAQAQLETIREVSNRLGLEFYSTAEGAKTFFAAGKDSTLAPELNRIFEGVSSAGAALALSKDEMQGAFLAIGQMISKGKVQAEELRGQLGERLPGAFQLAAQAMGMTTAQLDKFMADGKLTAEMLLPKLATVLQTTFGGAAMEAADGLQGQINRLSTAWTDLKAAMVDSKSAADAVGVLAGVLQTLAEHGELVTTSLAWAAWTAGAYGLIKAFTALRAVFMAINFASMAAAAGTLTTALGPVGLAAVAGLAAVGITKLVSSTQSADDIFKRHQSTIDAYREKMGLAAQSVDDFSTKQGEAARKSLERQRDILKQDTADALNGINAGISGVNSFSWANVLDSNGSALALVNARKEVVALGKDLAALGDNVTKQDLDIYAAKVLAVDERVRAAGLSSREWNTAITGLIGGSDSFVVKMTAMILQGQNLAEILNNLGYAANAAKAELAFGWSLNTADAIKGVAAIAGQIRGMEAEMAGLKSSKVLVDLLPDVSVEQIAQIRKVYGNEGFAGVLREAGGAATEWSTEQRVALIDVLDATEELDATLLKHKSFTDAQRDASKSHASAVNQETRNVGAYQSEIDSAAASIRSLQAQLATNPGEVFTREQLKIAADYETTLARINKETAAYAGKNGVSQAQADKLAEQKKLEAGLQRDLELKQAQVKEDQRLAGLARDRCEFYKELEELSGRYGLSIEDQNKLLDAQEVQLRRLGIPEEYIQQWRQLKELQASHDWVDGAKRGLLEYQASASDTAKGTEQAFSDLFNGIDSGFNGMWADLIENGKVSLSSFRSMFASFLADLMHMAITRPITVSIAGVVSGMLPGATGSANAAQAAAQAGGIAPGGGGYGNLTSFLPNNLFSGITDTINNTMSSWMPSLFAPAGSVFATSGGALTTGTMSTAAINSIGSAGYGGLSAANSLSTFTGAITPYLGAAGLGSMGYSMLGGMIGLPQSKYSGLTAGLGSAAGWGLGSLAAGSLAGGSGALAGAAAGSVIPVIGTILGALGGGLLGSLFGGERKTKPSVYTLSNNMPVDSNYDYTGAFTQGAWYDRAGSKEAEKIMPILGDAAKVAAQQVEALVAALPEEFRGQVEAEIAASSFSAGRGVPGMDKHNWNFQFYDEEQLKERLEAVVKDIQVAIGKTAQEAMADVDLTSMYNFDLGTSEGMDRAVKAVTSVKEITEATKAISEPASQLVEQAKAAKKQMEEWTASMEEYGVVTEYAASLMDKFRQANIDAALGDIADATKAILEPTSELVLQARAAKEQMDGWLEGMAEYGADMDAVNAAVDEYHRTVIKANIDALESSISPLSAYEQAVNAANKAVDDRKAALMELGASEEDLARVEGLRAGVLESMTASMLTGFEQDLRLRQAQLSGDADAIASTQLTIQHERELADVREKFGEDSVQYAKIQYMQIAETAQLAWQQQQAAAQAAQVAAQKLLQEQAKAAQDALSAANKDAAEANSALSAAQNHLNAVRSAYLSALNKEAGALQSTVDSVSRAVEQLSRTRRDLLTSDASPLGTDERYALTGAELERTFNKAMSGDAEAMADLSRLSSQYLDVSKEANADFSKYRKDFDKVQAMLAAVETSGLSQIDTAQKQLDLLNAQIAAATEGTGQIVGSIKELEAAFVAALGDYTSAQEEAARAQEAARKAQEAAEEARRKAEEAADKAQQDSQQSAQKPWMQDVLERKAAAMNRGETLTPGQTAGGWTVDRVLQSIFAAGESFESWYAKYGKLEGFAKGGLASGWALVGEQGPELVNFSSPGRVYTADDTADMLNPPTATRTLSLDLPVPPPSVDSNAALISEIKALRREVSELRSEQGRGLFSIADATQRTERTLARWDYDGQPEIRNQ